MSKVSGITNMAKQALLVVDVQNDFCLPTSPLGVKGALACLVHVQAAVTAARAKGIPVIWVVREHHHTGEALHHRPTFQRSVGFGTVA